MRDHLRCTKCGNDRLGNSVQGSVGDPPALYCYSCCVNLVNADAAMATDGPCICGSYDHTIAEHETMVTQAAADDPGENAEWADPQVAAALDRNAAQARHG